MPKKKAKRDPRGFDEVVLKHLEEFCLKYNCPSEETKDLIKLALSPRPKRLDEMSIAEIKLAVANSWKKETYALLSKDSEWKTYHLMTEMNGRLRTTWENYYREWVAFPENERNLKEGYGVINGVDVFKNFRPWEVFNIDKKSATKEQVRLAFSKLSFKYHPDTGKDHADELIFQKLLEMRDSLLIIFK